MKSWPDTNDSAIVRYLRQLRLRSRVSQTYYYSVLRGFQDVVARRQRSSSRVSRNTLEAWLRERAAQWAARTVLHRARIVDHFLDFPLREGSIARNPVAELRAEYCVRGTVANDASETAAIRLVFGDHANRLAVSSTKSMHGHALGAAGALEAIATALTIDRQIIPPTANYEGQDAACDLDVVPNQARSCVVDVALSNSFAFGGLNAVLAFQQWKASP